MLGRSWCRSTLLPLSINRQFAISFPRGNYMRPVVNGINIQRDPGRSGGLVKPSTTSIGSAPFGQRLLLSIVLGNAARHHGQIC